MNPSIILSISVVFVRRNQDLQGAAQEQLLNVKVSTCIVKRPTQLLTRFGIEYHKDRSKERQQNADEETNLPLKNAST